MKFQTLERKKRNSNNKPQIKDITINFDNIDEMLNKKREYEQYLLNQWYSYLNRELKIYTSM